MVRATRSSLRGGGGGYGTWYIFYGLHLLPASIGGSAAVVEDRARLTLIDCQLQGGRGGPDDTRAPVSGANGGAGLRGSGRGRLCAISSDWLGGPAGGQFGSDGPPLQLSDHAHFCVDPEATLQTLLGLWDGAAADPLLFDPSRDGLTDVADLLTAQSDMELDPWEPDATPASTETLVPSEPQYFHTLWPPGDVDWARFDVAAAGKVFVRTHGSRAMMRLALFADADPLGDPLIEVSGVEPVLSALLQPGSYLVRVDAPGEDAGALYHLAITAP